MFLKANCSITEKMMFEEALIPIDCNRLHEDRIQDAVKYSVSPKQF